MTDLRFLDPETLVNRAAFNERFEMLNQLMFGLGNQYLWEKISHKWEYEERNLASGLIICQLTQNVYFSSSFKINDSGKFILEEYQVDTGANVNENKSLTGKYFVSVSYDDVLGVDSLWFIPQGKFTFASSSTLRSPAGSIMLENTRLTAQSEGYVNSSDPSAYPPAEPDGYTYTALGQVGSKVRIETGSYTGTGTYGSSNPNSLTFGFKPSIVFILSQVNPGDISVMGGHYGLLQFFTPFIEPSYATYGYGYFNFSANSIGSKSNFSKFLNNTLWWYNNGSADSQFNQDKTYRYFAIG